MKLKAFLLLGVLAVSFGCASIGTPFIKMRPDYSEVPEAELHAAAAAIEKAILQEERELQSGDFPGVVLDTPEIKQAIRTRAARAALVKEFLASGHVYEQRGGTIKIMNSREYKKNTTRRERDKNAVLIMGENQSRWALYEGIVKASNWPSSALGAVQHSFYQARISLLAPGARYEDESGTIVVK